MATQLGRANSRYWLRDVRGWATGSQRLRCANPCRPLYRRIPAACRRPARIQRLRSTGRNAAHCPGLTARARPKARPRGARRTIIRAGWLIRVWGNRLAAKVRASGVRQEKGGAAHYGQRRHHLCFTIHLLLACLLPQRPLGARPHRLHLPAPVDHRDDPAQQVPNRSRPPLTRRRRRRRQPEPRR